MSDLIQPVISGTSSQWFVYLLLCADGTIYTGCTTDVIRRLAEHNGSKRGARYTRSRRPVRLLASFSCDGRSAALREENRIKRLSRQEKLALVMAESR